MIGIESLTIEEALGSTKGFRRLTSYLFACAAGQTRCRADAEDLVSDAITKSLAGSRICTTWITTKNGSIHFARYIAKRLRWDAQSKWRNARLHEELSDTLAAKSNSPSYDWLVDRARRLLSRLPKRPDQDDTNVPETIAAMYFLDSTSPDDISTCIGCIPIEAESALSRARRRLTQAQELGLFGPEDDKDTEPA